MTDERGFSSELKNRLAGISLRKLEERSGWSKSAIGDWLSGRRIPTALQLDELLTGAAVPEPERIEWLARLPAANSAPLPPVSESGPPQPRSFRRVAIWWLIPAALAGALIGYLLPHSQPPSPTSAPNSTTSKATGGFTPTVIAGGTPYAIANTEGLGVSSYAGPARASGEVGQLSEGDAVLVICQDPAGEVITDYVAGQLLAWPVWSQLASGAWVPDLYLNTDKTWIPGTDPPPLGLCLS